MKNLTQYTTSQRLQKLTADIELSTEEFNSQDINSSSWRTRADLLSHQSRITLREISFNSWRDSNLLTVNKIVSLCTL